MMILLALLLLAALLMRQGRRPKARQPVGRVPEAARELYTRRNFLKLGLAVGGAAALAYSGADEAVEEWHYEDVRDDDTNTAARFFHEWGERWWFVGWGLFAVADAAVASTPLTRWGRRNFESLVVGLPTLWTVQRGLGAARPKDLTHGPRFAPLQDDNTASGHAFVSAIPWLQAAHMLQPTPAKAAAGLMALPTGWSRLHDRKHYPSQVLLGWGIAWESVRAVHRVDAPKDGEA